MALAHGSGITTDGLVLAYDNGSSQSWKGAPTTNLLDGYNPETPATTMYWYASSGNMSFTQTNVLKDEVNGWYYADVRVGYSSQSSYHNAQLYTGNLTLSYNTHYTFSAWVWTDRAFTLRHGSIKNGSPWSWYVGLQAHSLQVGWNYVTTSTTSPMGTTYTDARYQFSFGYAPSGTHLKVYQPQLEAYQFATPFTPTSRSTTQALTDWVSGQTITMLSLNDYNSTEKFSFDGTNNTDRGIAIPSQNLNNSYSVEAWFKFDTGGLTQGIIGDYQYGWYRFVLSTNNQIYAGHINNASGYSYNFITAPTQLSTGTYHHAVHVFDENAGQRIYINGSLDASNTNSLNFLLSSRGPQYIGQDRNSAPSTRNVLDGTVPILRIYKNKALSASEVAKNYNALRGRFGV
ncbi:MAG: putative concanavalin A-like lectin/glucanases superfamily protein [Prokaryotic dsDNA virus sp.]|nr:MAG: putative concanavalin A-like lectin/glucanases superfamily protein [Prokaryotic dsDNA virus sp.]|tara:strand:+ start:3365 stop:4570 length:1206 start_codon:yes stop_codon:yes gene_type:complete